MRFALLATLGLAAFPAVALAHDGVIHANEREAQKHLERSQTPLPPPTNLPFPIQVGGAFSLTDDHGKARSQADPEGRLQLVFFGYANCPAICSVALPLMGHVTADLVGQGIDVVPVMITVDPERDRVGTMGAQLRMFHPTFVGLTGTEADLQLAYDAFSVTRELVFEDPEYGPIYAHGSHIYLLDSQGAFLTLLPPILSEDRVAEIVTAHAQKQLSN